MNIDIDNKTYYLWVLGCQMNESDGEKIRYLLENAGYKAAQPEKAGLIIVLACSVRQKPVDRIWGHLRNWQDQNPDAQFVLSGCVTKKDRTKFEKEFDYIFDIENMVDFGKYLGLDLSKKDYLELKSSREHKSRAFVPIMTGCNNFCSYCVVPHTRGRERSRRKEEIVDEIKCLLKEGYSEIVLLGQNVNSYQDLNSSRNKSDFVGLLKDINSLKGDFEIEFLTSHPKDMSDDLIEALGSLDKLSNNLHLPVQSGDDDILKRMNRSYTSSNYLTLIDKIKKSNPKLVLTTDIIVGFPGESREQFQNTLELVKQVGFEKAYVSKYNSRPGTAAEKFEDDISDLEKKRRWQILNDYINKNSPQE